LLKYLRTHMRWIMAAIAFLFLFSTFLMYDTDFGGSRGRNAPPSEETRDDRQRDYAVAVINGSDLMRSQLELMVRNYVQQANLRDLKAEDIPYLYQATLDNTIFQIELDKEIKARNLEVSEEEITAQVNIMADSFPTREAFFQSVQRSGIKMDDLRRDVRRRILAEKTVEAAIGGDTVSEDAVFEFYDSMKGLFYTRPKGFTFDMIEVSVDQTARELRDKIAADVDKWKEIISEEANSSDIVRVTTEPTFISEFILSNDAKRSFMMDLEIGEVGHVFEVRSDDFMIVIKRENRDETITPYDEVSNDIRSMMEQQHQRTALERFRNELIARAVVEIKDSSVFPSPIEITEVPVPEDTDADVTEPIDITEETVPEPEQTPEDTLAVGEPVEETPAVETQVEETPVVETPNN